MVLITFLYNRESWVTVQCNVFYADTSEHAGTPIAMVRYFYSCIFFSVIINRGVLFSGAVGCQIPTPSLSRIRFGSI